MEPFIGQIQAFGFNFAPRGWAQCNGQLLSIQQYTALFSLIGTTFGGDGRTTFALPDLRGRSMVGIGTGPGISNITWGERGGNEATTLTTNNLPAHNHPVSVAVNTANGEESSSTLFLSSHASAFSDSATSGAVLAGVSSGNTGNGLPFSNREPFLGINVCIALQGIFPSRN
jgi:microcystin-dependent protein